MRRRDALRAAERFVKSHYSNLWEDGPEIEVAEEQDGERAKSWSFGVHPPDHPNERGYVGYVHANGHVEGLY